MKKPTQKNNALTGKIQKLAQVFGAESPKATAAQTRAALDLLDQGLVHVVDPETLKLAAWTKRAILSYFQTQAVRPMSAGVFAYQDKIPLKTRARLKGVRVVPGAIVRTGAYVAPGAILMPSLVNIGAYVGPGTLIDTWATVGSCAYVGANCHISGGVGIGGVLEPAQAMPVVIEDGAFLGSRVIVVEGVRIGREAVIGAGVTLTASTKIVDVRGQAPVISTGFIPERAVVIPGTLPKAFPAGEFGVPCALIIGTRGESTDRKTSLNAALRDYGVSV